MRSKAAQCSSSRGSLLSNNYTLAATTAYFVDACYIVQILVKKQKQNKSNHSQVYGEWVIFAVQISLI